MEQNRSLAISGTIQECRTGDIIGLLETEFPSSVLNIKDDEKKTRE